MANIMTKRGQQDNIVTYEHICDTVADMANIEPAYITLGSVCIVVKGTNGLEVYIADTNKEWTLITMLSGGSTVPSGDGSISNALLAQINAAYAHSVTNKGAAFQSGLYKIQTNSEGHIISATLVTPTDIANLTDELTAEDINTIIDSIV